MKKYKVTLEYRGTYVAEVEANSQQEAEWAGAAEADENLNGFISVYSADAEEQK